MYMYMHLLLPTSLNYPVTIRPSMFYVTNVDWKDLCEWDIFKYEFCVIKLSNFEKSTFYTFRLQKIGD